MPVEEALAMISQFDGQLGQGIPVDQHHELRPAAAEMVADDATAGAQLI